MSSVAQRKLQDKIAQGIFSLGGFSIVVLISLLIFFLVKEFLPLFKKTTLVSENSISLPQPFSAISIFAKPSEDGKLGIFLGDDGILKLLRLSDNQLLKKWALTPTPATTELQKGHLIYSGSGSLFAYPFRFLRDSKTGLETNAFLGEKKSVPLPFPQADVLAVKSISEEETIFAAASENTVYYLSNEVSTNFMGVKTEKKIEKQLTVTNRVAGLVFYPGNLLLVAQEDGEVLILNKEGNQVGSFENPSPLSCFKSLFGDRAVFAGGKDGSMNIWSEAVTDKGRKFFLIHKLRSSSHSIIDIVTNQRDRSFLTWNSKSFSLMQPTAECRLLSFARSEEEHISASDKGEHLLSYGKQHRLFQIDNRHAEVTLKSLFCKIWYEGYAAPGYYWQSTGGTQDFEPKFSLIPLILGTLKGATFAMIFALPLALSGALFMNQFLHPRLHPFLKPIVEIMAGLPSVIIGFLAGLWLAPILQHVLPGVLLACLLAPIATVAWGMFIEKQIFKRGQDVFRIEILLLLPGMILCIYLCILASPWLEKVFFQNDFKQFIFQTFHTPYDQRNAVVVGFAMGFAVIPIIFSLAEDAISFVPKEIIAGSLALGLSRWKTAIGVVLKSASPGILSAVMVGFGRAIGETMIVLMATGNTPILSFFPFNGFRTLSANIAVELPEAPVGGSLYRILFFTAFLLFLFTFLLNSSSHLFRRHWQKKLKA